MGVNAVRIEDAARRGRFGAHLLGEGAYLSARGQVAPKCWETRASWAAITDKCSALYGQVEAGTALYEAKRETRNARRETLPSTHRKEPVMSVPILEKLQTDVHRGDLRFSLWSNEERGNRVLRALREVGGTGGMVTNGPCR
jgi:hypothetical protein